MKEAQVSLKLKGIAKRGELDSLPSLAIYDSVVYYARRNKLSVAEYVKMTTGEDYKAKRTKKSPLAQKLPPHVLKAKMETQEVSAIAAEVGFSKQAVYKLIERYKGAGVWDAKSESS